MNISICITVLNEEKTIGRLLDSLLNQSLRAKEIVIVDGGSKDKTLTIVQHYQKKNKEIKLLREECSRARGRNLAVEIAKSSVVALIDAGCVADCHWLKKLIQPFLNEEVGVVAGFYRMKANNNFQKALSFFLGVLPRYFDAEFLPSARSMAFRKEVWEKVGGFTESKVEAADDTIFNYRLLKHHVRISRVKDAVVEWGIPANLKDAFIKFFNYARGDAETKIFFFPGKGITSHNIKVLFVFGRYLLFLYLLICAFAAPRLWFGCLVLVLVYFFYAFRKTLSATRHWPAGLWGIAIQLTADAAVMAGFIAGLLLK